MIPAPHPQWRDLDLVDVVGAGAAFVNLGSQNSLLNPGGAVKTEGIWRHGRQPGGCHLNMLALAAAAREARLPFFWFRWERFRHRHPASAMDAAQYAYWRRSVTGDLDAQRDWNADLVDDVKAIMRPDDVNLVYPGFASIFVGTPFEMHLTRRGIRTLILSGYHTEWCIESAARSARDLGYMPIVVGDACAAETPEVHVATLERLNAIFAPVVSTETAIEVLRKAAAATALRSRPGTTA
jgi:nicotinamidase-related amidase